MTDQFCEGCPRNLSGDMTPNTCPHYESGECPFLIQIEEWNRMVEEERADFDAGSMPDPYLFEGDTDAP